MASKLKLIAVALCLSGAVTVAQTLVSLEGSFILPVNDRAIRYNENGRRNAVARLQDSMGAGKVDFAYDPKSGYLKAVLKALDVPVSSQVLVFSKTSFQAPHISPGNPRAIYFNDSVAVGHVPGSDLLEITATDPDAGVVFYTLDRLTPNTPMITRRDECLQCHAIPNTLGVPGLVVRSV